jgi:hypothetical protein
MKNKVYIETSIPSFYHENRTDAAAMARKDWTRQWWDNYRYQFELFSSIAVIEELQNGEYFKKDDCLSLMANIQLLPIESEIAEITDAYIKHKIMPNNPVGDALHLAITSYYKCDYLLTWNCKHIANANKFQHIRQINVLLGLFTPNLITPLELLGEYNDE